MIKRIFHWYFVAGSCLLQSCCLEGSPFDLNDTDWATLQSIGAFELYQARAMELARASEGAPKLLAEGYDWDLADIALDLEKVANSNAIVLPTEINQHYLVILEDLQNIGSSTFSNRFLHHSSVELSQLINDLEKQQRQGADIGVNALNAKLLPLLVKQHAAVDSLRQLN